LLHLADRALSPAAVQHPAAVAATSVAGQGA